MKSLKVLFVPVDAAGHVYACVSLGQTLLRAGHRVVFATCEQWRQTLENYGFQVVTIQTDDMPDTVDPVLHIAEYFLKSKKISDLSPLEKTLRDSRKMTAEMTIDIDRKLGPMLKEIAPDVIVCDQFATLPSVETSGIPWVWSWSANPLYMYGNDDEVPVVRLGLPANGDRGQWKELKQRINNAHYEGYTKINEYVVSKGGQPLKPHQFTNGSPYLNVYAFPEELDYNDIKPLPKHYFRFDNLMRSDIIDNTEKFEIPEKLRDRPGKLVYLSFGTMCAVDIELMKRLVSILAESKHRFIVSKGPLHDKYELADNMWGQKTVPQMQVLPLVDLVITHGGNNTVCESFFFGKPMIVMPFFGDQTDNAQRIHEKGFGVRLDPYRCSKQELLESIDKLLNDKELNEKLRNISRRIQSENSIEKFPKLIENLVK